MSTSYPFLDRVPLKSRGSAMEKLARYQFQKYGFYPEFINGLKSSAPDITIDAPEWEEENIAEVNQEMAEPPHGQEKVD